MSSTAGSSIEPNWRLKLRGRASIGAGTIGAGVGSLGGGAVGVAVRVLRVGGRPRSGLMLEGGGRDDDEEELLLLCKLAGGPLAQVLLRLFGCVDEDEEEEVDGGARADEERGIGLLFSSGVYATHSRLYKEH